MKKIRAFLARLPGIFGSSRREREMSEELEANLQLHVEDNLRAGLSPSEARRQAVLVRGGMESSKECYRDRAGLPFLETLAQDVRYAIRSFRGNAGYAAVAILTLALGIGANTAMFSVARAVLFRPLPYAEPGRLVAITETNPLKHWINAVAAPANFADWQRMNTVFTGIAAYGFPQNVFLGGTGSPRQLTGLQVTGNLFDVLGVPPLLGRTLRNEETFEGKDRVAVLSYDLWQSVFAADPRVAGRQIVLTGKTYEVVGVMPRGFFFPGYKIGIFIPLGVPPKYFVEQRRPHQLNTIARLRPGVSMGRALSQMTGIAGQLEKTYPATNTKMGVRLDLFHDTLTSEKRQSLLMLLAAVGVLLLIVCSNVANLQLGRAAARAREISIRQALGADRGRLVRQFLTESLILSIAGGALGLGLAAAALKGLLRYAPSAIPGFADLRMDPQVILFAIAVTLCAPLLFGVLPALSSSHLVLGERSGTAPRAKRTTRDLLAVCEVALSVVLVTASGLLIHSLILLENVQPGFNPQHAVSFTVLLPQARYPKDEQCAQAYRTIADRLRTLPGVETVGASTTLPLGGYTWTQDVTPEGRGRTSDDYEREMRNAVVTPGYFRAMGTPLLRGRAFNEFDTAKSPPVAMVNQALEKTYFHGGNAVGKRIKLGRPGDSEKGSPWVTVVGLVADFKQDGLGARVLPEAYFPETQETFNQLTFVLRGRSNADALVAASQEQIHAVDRELVLTDIKPLRDILSQSTGDERFRTSLLSAFAAVALFLAVLGVYGVLSYAVTQRLKEIGIRLALGASRGRLFGMVLRDGMWPVVLGGILGLGGAVAVMGFIKSLLFGIAPFDPATFVATVAALAVAAAVACAIPASRAINVDPSISLRDQ